MGATGSPWSLAADPVVLVGIVLAVVVAGLGGWLTETGDWYQGLRFPAWKPPNWLFGPAWTVIFALIVAGGVQAWWAAPEGAERVVIALAFAVNGLLNVAWSGLFFRLRRPDWAAVEVFALWLSIALLVLVAARHSTAAAWCLAPYLAWVSFAAMLNVAIVRLNPRFG